MAANQVPIVVLIVIFISDKVSSDAGCPDGWVSDGNSCYLFDHDHPGTFVAAEHFCRLHESYIVHIKDEYENTFLKDYISELAHQNGYYIGLTDMETEGKWQWYDTGIVSTFTDWYPGEPTNNYGGSNEDCVAFGENPPYRWFDVPCDVTRLPLCERSKQAVIIG